MHLLITEINDILFKEAIEYFEEDNNYLINIENKPTFIQSIISRYLISKHIEENFWIKKYYPKTNENWTPIFEKNIYWSISHKWDYIFIWIWKEKIWIDIEIFKERDISLLDKITEKEYEILWWKNWQTFYTLWTGKESIIKRKQLKLDDIYKIKLKENTEEKNTKSGIIFSKKLIFDFNWEKLKVLSWMDNYLYYSVCSWLILIHNYE